MITPTVMTPVTPKQKSINISLYHTQAVVILVLVSYLLMPYGIGAIKFNPTKYVLFSPFYHYFRQFGRVGLDITIIAFKYVHKRHGFGLTRIVANAVLYD